MIKIPFYKVQSIGNHFPLVLHSDLPLGYTDDNLTELAKEICREHYGVGGDGLLILEVCAPGLKLRMFNPDGSEDFCGNGLRCAAHFAKQRGLVAGDTTIVHRERSIDVKFVNDQVLTTIGKASYDPKDVPTSIAGELFDETIYSGRDSNWSVVLQGSALSTGSTHVVLPTGALPDDEGFIAISKSIETDARFPEKTSVIWVVRDGDALKVRIWERGAGETQGCGTGSAAAAVDWMRRRQRGGKIEVKNPGGTVVVSADGWNRPITLEAKAEELFEGFFESKVEFTVPTETQQTKNGSDSVVGP